MFTLKYFKVDELVGELNFETLIEAQDNIHDSEFASLADRYSIIDSKTDEEIEEDEIPNEEDELDRMFDDEDSKEGFDWTLGS